MYNFSGIVEHKGYAYYIWLPEALSKKFEYKGNVPVRGLVNNIPFKGTLIKRKPNRHVLNLTSEIRKKARISEFDEVKASVEYDPVSREIPLPEDVEWILKEDDFTWQEFNALSPSRRKDFLFFILDAKKPETRLKRIEILIKRLNDGTARKAT